MASERVGSTVVTGWLWHYHSVRVLSLGAFHAVHVGKPLCQRRRGSRGVLYMVPGTPHRDPQKEYGTRVLAKKVLNVAPAIQPPYGVTIMTIRRVPSPFAAMSRVMIMCMRCPLFRRILSANYANKSTPAHNKQIHTHTRISRRHKTHRRHHRPFWGTTTKRLYRREQQQQQSTVCTRRQIPRKDSPTRPVGTTNTRRSPAAAEQQSAHVFEAAPTRTPVR